MGRDTIQLEDAVSTISQEYLLEFTSEYGIPEGLHPELPSPEETIVDFPEGKVGVYTKFFEFANHRIPLSQFLFELEQSLLLGRREDIPHRRGLAHKRPKGWDAISRLLFRSGQMDFFSLIRNPNPFKVKTGTRPRAAHEVPLLTAMAIRVIVMEDTAVTSGSSGTPSTIERSPLDFDNENPAPSMTEGIGAEDQAQDGLAHEIPLMDTVTTTEVVQEVVREEEVAAMEPPVNKRRKQMRRKRVNEEVEVNASPKVLRKDHVSSPAHNIDGGKSLATMGLDAGSTFSTPAVQHAPTTAKSMSDPDPLSSSKGATTEIPTEPVATTEVNVQLSVGSPSSGKSTSVPSVDGSPSGIYQPGWGVTNSCRLDTTKAYQDMIDHTVPPGYFSKLRHLPNAEFLGQYNMNLTWQVAMGSQLRLRTVETEVHGLRNRTQNLETLLEAEVDMKKVVEARNADLASELKGLCAQFFDLQVNNKQLSQQVSTLQSQVTGEERIKVAFEEFKKYEDDKVEQRCAEMDARLDALSIYFDEELYPHMLMAIAGRRWVIGHGLRLAVMKCAESTELRRAFADVVTLGSLRAETKYVAALNALKGLKYPLVDQLSDGVSVSIPTVAPQGLAILLADAAVQTEDSEDEASPTLLRSKSLPPMYNLDWP
ncbi:hypothetical protein Tco_0568533 [Tanacetum coccineum]